MFFFGIFIRVRALLSFIVHRLVVSYRGQTILGHRLWLFWVGWGNPWITQRIYFKIVIMRSLMSNACNGKCLASHRRLMSCFIALKWQIADTFFFKKLESCVANFSSCCLALLMDQVLWGWPKLGVHAHTYHDLRLISRCSWCQFARHWPTEYFSFSQVFNGDAATDIALKISLLVA